MLDWQAFETVKVSRSTFQPDVSWEHNLSQIGQQLHKYVILRIVLKQKTKKNKKNKALYDRTFQKRLRLILSYLATSPWRKSPRLWGNVFYSFRSQFKTSKIQSQ